MYLLALLGHLISTEFGFIWLVLGLVLCGLSLKTTCHLLENVLWFSDLFLSWPRKFSKQNAVIFITKFS